jgi:glycosyltransferase involved in cell wall biosynthesis
MKINFISNINPSEISGGISGMNAVAYAALSEIADVRYVGPINPPASRLSEWRSKVRRRLGMPGEFYFFNRPRLQQIANEVERQCDTRSDFDFYMGFTPWILCKNPRPYVAWNDCSFNDYLKIYHHPDDFSITQQKWLSRTEAAWMTKATKVLFSSQWAMKRTSVGYQLPAERLQSVGIFGGMEEPESDNWNGSKDFYFISTNYNQKNGHLCCQAMDKVWNAHPDARLRIIGSPPPASDLVSTKVTYEGFYNKNNPTQLAAFRELLSKAFALIHPTDSDISPLTVIEAGYFGCPSISVDDFALREVTSPSNHHLLLQRPLTSSALADAMIRLLDDPSAYQKARHEARTYAVSNLSQDAFKQRLQEVIEKTFLHC